MFSFRRVAEKPRYPACFVNDGVILLTLRNCLSEEPTDFDRKIRVRLHHFALKLKDANSLGVVLEKLREHESVTIEFEPEGLGSSPHQHMTCTFFDDVRLEIFAQG